ncbi:hypothetical protein [Terrabacter sp. 2RAF25]|uniref:hypothetical protein n=1 Tax=Terrabacter sp. 2RAF25 TaxID=3232998 RepID=UPI003F9B3BD9
MSVKSEVVEALREAEHENSRSWSLHAANLAHGIEKSGIPALLGDIKEGMATQGQTLRSIEAESRHQASLIERTNSSIVALAAVNAAGFDAICRQLGETNQLLSGIEQMLANPLSTAAAERYRRGIHALSQEWFEPALKELDAAIAQDPFQALSHFARGLALGSLGRDRDSIAAFRDAILYTGKDPALLPVLAGAAILAGQVADKLGDRGEALRLLAVAKEKTPNCAEAWLASARLTGSRDELLRALTIAPELAVVAVAGKVPDAVTVAEQVAAEGPVASMRAAVETLRPVGLTLHLPASNPEALTFHRSWRDQHHHEAARLAEEAITREQQLHAQARLAETTASTFKAATSHGAARSLLRRVALLLLSALVLAAVIQWMMTHSAPADTLTAAALIPGGVAVASGVGVLIFGLATLSALMSTISESLNNGKAQRRGHKHHQALTATATSVAAEWATARAKADAAIVGRDLARKSIPSRLHPLTTTR